MRKIVRFFMKFYVFRMIAKELIQVIRFFNKKRKSHIMKRMSTTSEAGIIKVGFIVQMPSLWDKQSGVYEEIKKRENMQALMFVVPQDDWENLMIKNNYEGNYFIQNYPEAIKVYNNDNQLINLETYRLDYLFYPRPYDEHLPKKYRSSQMMKTVKCCYIPYTFAMSDAFFDYDVKHPFFDNIYFNFMDCEYMKEQLIQEYKSDYKKGIRKIEYLGYPCIDKYINMGETGKTQIITWTPRWSYDEKTGGSNFLEFKDNMFELFQKDRKYIFRPHPLMFDELLLKGLISREEKKEYLKKLEDYGVCVDYVNPIDDILEKTDVLISDFSAIVVTFFITGRPLIYCDKGIELNEEFKEMEQYMYMVHNWDELYECYQRVVIMGQDELRTSRLDYIQKKYGTDSNASKKIVDKLMKDTDSLEW